MQVVVVYLVHLVKLFLIAELVWLFFGHVALRMTANDIADVDLVWHRCTGVHIFGDAKKICPNFILFFPNNVYIWQALILKLKPTIVNKSRFLHA